MCIIIHLRLLLCTDSLDALVTQHINGVLEKGLNPEISQKLDAF